jgi:hypothetical protein
MKISGSFNPQIWRYAGVKPLHMVPPARFERATI